MRFDEDEIIEKEVGELWDEDYGDY